MTGLVSVGSPKPSRVASIATVCAKMSLCPSGLRKMAATLKFVGSNPTSDSIIKKYLYGFAYVKNML